eukprot:6081197-Amphidinium_carterae.1
MLVPDSAAQGTNLQKRCQSPSRLSSKCSTARRKCNNHQDRFEDHLRWSVYMPLCLSLHAAYLPHALEGTKACMEECNS